MNIKQTVIQGEGPKRLVLEAARHGAIVAIQGESEGMLVSVRLLPDQARQLRDALTLMLESA